MAGTKKAAKKATKKVTATRKVAAKNTASKKTTAKAARAAGSKPAPKLGKGMYYDHFKAMHGPKEAPTRTVHAILKQIIADHLHSFRSDGTFKVRPGYGYDKFYLDTVDGSYDMSLQGLVHYILFEEGVYKDLLSKAEFRQVENCIRDNPEGIYSPDDTHEWLDEVHFSSIEVAAKELHRLGFDDDSLRAFVDYFEGMGVEWHEMIVS